MFTGLIEDLGRVRAVREHADGASIAVETGLASQIELGDSVSVNGVCLTATESWPDGFGAQAMNETLRRSSLGTLRDGSPVNLELALRADARLGGHIVQGHVDGTAAVAGVREDGFARVIDLALDAGSSELQRGGVEGPAGSDEAHADGVVGDGRRDERDLGGGGSGLARYLVQKGSVAVDGVSLTVSELCDDGFSVSLIPETLQRTNLGSLRVGDRVNVEVDILAKHVERLLRRSRLDPV